MCVSRAVGIRACGAGFVLGEAAEHYSDADRTDRTVDSVCGQIWPVPLEVEGNSSGISTPGGTPTLGV